ncbi:MAG: hypothetical protein KDB27_19605 [Planctomycetales bacterium]|nr:hypothetical protein [Planctomycetales bacterium]
MNTARKLLLVLAVASTGLFGCQATPDPSIELLESELRWYEDQLYLMDRQLGQCCQQLESTRRYNAALQAEIATLSSSEDPVPEPAKPKNRPLDLLKNLGSGKAKKSSAGDSENYQVPSVMHGSDDAESVDDANLGPDNADPSGSGQTPPNDVYDEELHDFLPDEISGSAMFGDNFVTQVVFNSQLTGGHNVDGRPGDDGLYVVLEPKSLSGQYVPAPAELTIEVFDGTESSNTSTRLARWDFDVADTTAAMRKSLLGQGIHLQLAWPAETPESTELTLRAKYIRADGKRLTATRTVRVDPLGVRSLRR